MTSLTRMLDESASPLSQWMRKTFPNVQSTLAEVRRKAGRLRIEPPNDIALGTQGTAIDWWVRFLLDSDVPDIGLVIRGLQRLNGHPVAVAVSPLLGMPGHPDQDDDDAVPLWALLDEPDEVQARVFFVLALLTEIGRAPVRQSRLLTVRPGGGLDAVLDLVSDAEVADLIRMRDSAQNVLLPLIPTGDVVTGPVFEGNRGLSADADIIVGDTLIELKATRGARARADGSRPVRFERTDLYQILGYLLMDYTDKYRIRTLMFYAIRYEHATTWTVDELLTTMAGRPLDLTDTRNAFATALQNQLPPYLVCGETTTDDRR